MTRCEEDAHGWTFPAVLPFRLWGLGEFHQRNRVAPSRNPRNLRDCRAAQFFSLHAPGPVTHGQCSWTVCFQRDAANGTHRLACGSGMGGMRERRGKTIVHLVITNECYARSRKKDNCPCLWRWMPLYTSKVKCLAMYRYDNMQKSLHTASPENGRN